MIASCRKQLPVPQGQRGLRQSEAVFTHVRQLPGLIEELSAYLTDCEIVAVCASRRPRDEEASYMPVFQAGDAVWRLCFAFPVLLRRTSAGMWKPRRWIAA